MENSFNRAREEIQLQISNAKTQMSKQINKKTEISPPHLHPVKYLGLVVKKHVDAQLEIVSIPFFYFPI